ncbi:MAG: hypothetical protein P4L82_14080, partial [Ancalomicrobiaceae bacterium]|nr:hypothetical protein [Ancalomicrobiaceae bacterium]
MSFKNWPMLWKVFSLLILLSAAGIAGIAYTTHQITLVDDLASAIINGPSASVTYMTRSNRYAITIEMSIYKSILADNEADDAAATQQRNDMVRLYHEQTDLAKRATPNFAADIDAIVQRLDNAVTTACATALKLANTDNSKDGIAKANVEMAQTCGPAIDAVSKASTALNAKFAAAKDHQNDAVAAVAAWTAWSSLIGFLVATAAVLAVAFVAVRTGVVAPVQASIGVMAALGRGELADSVPGTERDDEVGAIAKSLETLRGQLQEAERQRN